MAVSVRHATADDLLDMQTCNLSILPENYPLRYYDYHYLTWPEFLYTAEDDAGRAVGYVLGKLDDENDRFGHVTSLGVARNQRRMGVARRLLQLSHQAMGESAQATHCNLHVRVSNRAGVSLYRSLGYGLTHTQAMYYLDGEDAHEMRYPIQNYAATATVATGAPKAAANAASNRAKARGSAVR